MGLLICMPKPNTAIIARRARLARVSLISLLFYGEFGVLPGKRCCGLRVGADVFHQLSGKIGDGGEDAAGNDVALDFGKPGFDLIEPGRIRRG